LCKHHDISEFHSDDRTFVVELRDYWKRSAKSWGDRVTVAIEDGAVVGFVVTKDIDLTFEDDDTLTGTYFMVPVLAVSSPYLGSDIASMLVERAIEDRNSIESLRRDRYRGTVAVPYPGSKLAKALPRMGFEPLPNSVYWIKFR